MYIFIIQSTYFFTIISLSYLAHSFHLISLGILKTSFLFRNITIPFQIFPTMLKSPKIIGPCFHSTIFIIILIEWGWLTLAKILDSCPKPMKNDRKRWTWPRNLILNFKSAFVFQHKTIIFSQKINQKQIKRKRNWTLLLFNTWKSPSLQNSKL